MKIILICSVQFCFVVFCITTCLAETKELKRSKLYAAIIPSLRVGRRSDSTFDINTDVKRRIAKMVSFPRVGRSDSVMLPDDSYGPKRPGAASGLWFGPRLGRVQKRSDDYTPWSYVILNGEKPLSYAPQLSLNPDDPLDYFEDLQA